MRWLGEKFPRGQNVPLERTVANTGLAPSGHFDHLGTDK